MESLPLFVLEPPYTMVRWLRDVPPALGSILLLDGTGRRPTPTEVREVMSLAPWCPVVVTGRDRAEVRPIRRSSRVAVLAGDLSREDLGASVLGAVAGRPLPTPSDLTDWVVRRTSSPLLARTLSDLFSSTALRAASAGPPSSVWQRQLAQLGVWGATDWQVAAHLAEMASNREALARVRTAEDPNSAETRRLMADWSGVAGRDFQELHGWEWVLEVALRESGYFERAAEALRLTIRRGRTDRRKETVPAFAYDQTAAVAGTGRLRSA